MTWLAILFMSGSVLGVTALAAWCYFLLLRTPGVSADAAPDDEDATPPQLQ